MVNTKLYNCMFNRRWMKISRSLNFLATSEKFCVKKPVYSYLFFYIYKLLFYFTNKPQ